MEMTVDGVGRLWVLTHQAGGGMKWAGQFARVFARSHGPLASPTDVSARECVGRGKQ